MTLSARRTSLSEITALRERCLREATCQIVRWSLIDRGFAYPVAIEDSGRLVGFAAIQTMGTEEAMVHLYAPDIPDSIAAARVVLECTRSPLLEAQTNLPVMRQILDALGERLELGPFLFEVGEPSQLPVPFARFRARMPEDDLFPHTREPEGPWVIEADGRIVATGGFFSHYNPPYADLYMEVEASSQRRGFGSFLLQELMKVCLVQGLVPAARCDPTNLASAKCLERAGMKRCGELVSARLRS